MPRGAKIDKQATKEKHYKDERSFISLMGDEYLKGEDLKLRRDEVFAKSHGRCMLNVSPLCRGWITRGTFELDHIQGGLVGRNDNADNLRAVCKRCHRYRHIRPKWSSQERQNEHHSKETEV